MHAIAVVERAGWRGRSHDLSADSGRPWFSYSYEGAVESVNAAASSPGQARMIAAEEALKHPEYMELPTEPAERND